MSFKSFYSRLLIFTLILPVAALVFASCSKDESTTGPGGGKTMWVHMGSDSTAVPYEGLETIDADGEEAIRLSEFISTALIPPFEDTYDTRVLYAYRIVGDDGFSASVKGYPDNTWDQMELGHIMTASRNVVFPDDEIDLPGAYNVKEASHIYVYRKIDVVLPDTTVFHELKDMTEVQVEYEGEMVPAVSLGEFADLSVDDPSGYHYNMEAVDGFGPSSPMTWAEFQTGYWLLEEEKTYFTDPELTDQSRYKLKALEKIEMTEAGV